MCPVVWLQTSFRCVQFNRGGLKSIILPRLTLLLMVAMATLAIFVVENPAGTLLWQHDRFSHFCNLMAYVFGLQLYGIRSIYIYIT